MYIKIDGNKLQGAISCVVSTHNGSISLSATTDIDTSAHLTGFVDNQEHLVEVFDDTDSLYMVANALFNDSNTFIINDAPSSQSNVSITGTATGGLPDGSYYVVS